VLTGIRRAATAGTRAVPKVIAYTKNHNLRREPYRHQYAPSYIDAQKASSGYEKKGRGRAP
jgi:hypothetical protein